MSVRNNEFYLKKLGTRVKIKEPDIEGTIIEIVFGMQESLWFKIEYWIVADRLLIVCEERELQFL